jgi:crossover junction endodeoxyribonuclease RusA
VNDAPVSFTVFGLPKAQGSMKFIGRGRAIHSPELVKWRQEIAAVAVREMAARLPLDGPVVLDAKFYLPRPKSTPKRIVWPSKRPDLDKLVRAVGDALVFGGVLADDSQIVRLHATKHYSDTDWPCGVSVIVGQIDDDTHLPRV